MSTTTQASGLQFALLDDAAALPEVHGATQTLPARAAGRDRMSVDLRGLGGRLRAHAGLHKKTLRSW